MYFHRDHRLLSCLCAAIFLSLGSLAAERALDYAPALVNNPLKGLVPYRGKWPGRFPHNMEFAYIPLKDLVVGENQYNWQPLEKILNDVASRGHHTVFRIYLEYPGKDHGVPAYLTKQGLSMRPYGGKGKHAADASPDYEDPRLQKCLPDAIAAMGKRYDGDPRIAFITAGILGAWGEWHTYKNESYWASPKTQTIVLDAYEKAFAATEVLLRYPAGAKNAEHIANDKRPFGYHDDSFAWATLDTGKSKDSWFYQPLLKQAGPAAQKKWQTQPIGGEIRPEAWGKIFDPNPTNPKLQNFNACVKATHVSWLMDSGLFEKKTYTKPRHQRAIPMVQRMGYELHVSQINWETNKQTINLQITIENRGIAPFYYDWPVEIALLDPSKIVRSKTTVQINLPSLLPKTPPTVWKHALSMPQADLANY